MFGFSKSKKMLSKYFRVEGEVVFFENTGDLANDINAIISKLRKCAKDLPHIGPEAHHFIKRKTPGPKTVKLGVRAALRGNSFNYRTLQFTGTGKGALGGYVTGKVNKRLNKEVAAANTAVRAKAEVVKAQVTASAMSAVKTKVENIIGDYVSMFLLNQLKSISIPNSIKVQISNYISAEIMAHLVNCFNDE